MRNFVCTSRAADQQYYVGYTREAELLILTNMPEQAKVISRLPEELYAAQ